MNAVAATCASFFVNMNRLKWAIGQLCFCVT